MGDRISFAIYSFHMPAFFFVSGVFLRPSVERRGEKLFVTEKLRTMIYPYLLWAFIFTGATIPFARFMLQTTPSWKLFLFNLVTANYSWFLPTIFFVVMLGMLTRRVPMPLLFALSVAACLFFPHTQIGFLERGVRNFPFLVAGMWVGTSFKQMQRFPVAAAALLALLCCIAIVVLTAKPYDVTGYRSILLGLLGTFMLMLIARCMGRTAAARAFAWIGAASLGIFLMSSFPQGAGREFLIRVFHTTSPWPQLFFPTLLAVVIPAWLYHHRKHLHIEWMFTWPRSSSPAHKKPGE
jgi:fucose 4-O-acetylase-like acetyltransferase